MHWGSQITCLQKNSAMSTVSTESFWRLMAVFTIVQTTTATIWWENSPVDFQAGVIKFFCSPSPIQRLTSCIRNTTWQRADGTKITQLLNPVLVYLTPFFPIGKWEWVLVEVSLGTKPPYNSHPTTE